MNTQHDRIVWAGALACSLLLLAATPMYLLAQSANELDARVTQFVQGTYFHGVPYEEARNLGPRAVPILKRILDDESFKPYWANTVTAIAFIGEPEGFGILRSFVWDRFHGEVDHPTFRALAISQSVMGTIKGSDAVDYLVAGTNPSFWKGIPWTFERNRGSSLQILLSKLSINGLSYTGSPRAGVVLERLRKAPFAERQKPNIEEGLGRHKEIATRGQLDYLRSHNR